MKQLFIIALIVFALAPAAFAVNIGAGLTPDIRSEDFLPLIWMCESRLVLDDATEPGRISLDGTELFERTQNYAFEGEQISWTVLVMDKNGIQKIRDVFASIGPNRDARRMVSYQYQDTACLSDCSIAHSSCSQGCSQILNATNQTICQKCMRF